MPILTLLLSTAQVVENPVAHRKIHPHRQQLVVQNAGLHGVKGGAEVNKEHSYICPGNVKMVSNAVDAE